MNRKVLAPRCSNLSKSSQLPSLKMPLQESSLCGFEQESSEIITFREHAFEDGSCEDSEAYPQSRRCLFPEDDPKDRLLKDQLEHVLIENIIERDEDSGDSRIQLKLKLRELEGDADSLRTQNAALHDQLKAIRDSVHHAQKNMASAYTLI
jgi:hypothetical protein